ncbi:IS66-like element accessory protein TnpA [Roseivivax sp. CAU 1753]
MADQKFRPEIEVLSAADAPRRRHWSDGDKIAIVEESFLGHLQVTATARRHGVSRSLLTIWRRQYPAGEFGVETPPSFIPLAVSSMPPATVPATARETPRNTPDVQLEIVLRNGRRLLVPSSVEPEVLARLLPTLEGR